MFVIQGSVPIVTNARSPQEGLQLSSLASGVIWYNLLCKGTGPQEALLVAFPRDVFVNNLLLWSKRKQRRVCLKKFCLILPLCCVSPPKKEIPPEHRSRGSPRPGPLPSGSCVLLLLCKLKWSQRKSAFSFSLQNAFMALWSGCHFFRTFSGSKGGTGLSRLCHPILLQKLFTFSQHHQQIGEKQSLYSMALWGKTIPNEGLKDYSCDSKKKKQKRTARTCNPTVHQCHNALWSQDLSPPFPFLTLSTSPLNLGQGGY